MDTPHKTPKPALDTSSTTAAHRSFVELTEVERKYLMMVTIAQHAGQHGDIDRAITATLAASLCTDIMGCEGIVQLVEKLDPAPTHPELAMAEGRHC